MPYSPMNFHPFLPIGHRWALSPISVISDIGLSLISELPISDWESAVRHYIGYRNKVLSNIIYPTSHSTQTVTVAQWYSARLPIQGAWVRICKMNYFFSSMSDIGMSSNVDIGTLPISEWRFSVRHFCLRYRNNRCRCRISPTLSSMSMPTYAIGQHISRICTKPVRKAAGGCLVLFQRVKCNTEKCVDRKMKVVSVLAVFNSFRQKGQLKSTQGVGDHLLI